ncbi:hypothetical protein V1283_005883 [Bradyrhizobium sp. AZCC 2262]|uniref:hypothetical protein n=1 Tax=Bradyrhizobium sp. AZCC 2262 TaxID=3117022 RepID=UPI002FF116C3
MGASTKTAEQTVVNGINIDDLFARIDDVKREPEKGKTNWHVITTWQGQTDTIELDGEGSHRAVVQPESSILVLFYAQAQRIYSP